MVLNAIQFSADECDSACRLLHAPFERLAQGVYTVTVANGSGSGTLYAAIQQANAFGNGGTINIQDGLGTIDVGQLPDITVGLTINGGFGNTLSGQNQNRIFFVNAPGQAVQIDNMTLANGFAQGGNGGAGGGAGGGGGGLGGAVFINSGSVSFSSDVFTNNSAVGGAGGTAGVGGGGGGGGLSFNGGIGNNPGMISGGGGGGGGARTSVGAGGLSVSGGGGGGANGAAGGSSGIVTPNGSSATLPDGGGGGGGGDQSSPGSIINGGNGGNGSDFGAGGGGGRSLNNNSGAGGNGGFGAGGGGGAMLPPMRQARVAMVALEVAAAEAVAHPTSACSVTVSPAAADSAVGKAGAAMKARVAAAQPLEEQCLCDLPTALRPASAIRHLMSAA